MIPGFQEVISDSPLILMSPLIGFRCAMIGLKKSLGVGAERSELLYSIEGEEHAILETWW